MIQDPFITATIAAEVAEDEYAAAEYAIECKRRGYGYHPLASTKAEDARYLRALRIGAAAVRHAATMAGEDAGVSHDCGKGEWCPQYGAAFRAAAR